MYNFAIIILTLKLEHEDNVYQKLIIYIFEHGEQKMTKKYILDFLKQNRSLIESKFGVTKIGLFGSYARDEATLESDIDIAVEIESKNNFKSFFSLLHFLEDSLSNKIDLGIESSLKPIAKKTILKDIIYV